MAYTTRALDLHRGIVPAFANLAPEVLERFVGLGNPAAGGQGLRDQLAAYLQRQMAAGKVASGRGGRSRRHHDHRSLP